MANQDNRNEIMQELSKKLGTSGADLENSAKSGNIEHIIAKLNPAQQAKVRSLLQNPEETRKILENPQVQALIKRLKGNG